MSVPVRLDKNLVHDAEMEVASQKRSAPKQIEYWAEIGRSVARFASSSDLLALKQGFAQVNIVPIASVIVDPTEVFGALETDGEQGALSRAVTQAKVWYEASVSHPGLLDRVQADGTRETGSFCDGEFIPGP